MNGTIHLKRIRIIHYILLLCALLLIGFGSKGVKIGGVAVLALGIFIVWKFHRCPKCRSELDTRLFLHEVKCCPICGHDLNDTDTDHQRI